jgi:hypothetical protein
MGFTEVVLLCIFIVLILLLAQVRAASNRLARIHNDLRIVCTVLQESPAEKSEREKEDWEYSCTPNLIRQKRSKSGVPFYKED